MFRRHVLAVAAIALMPVATPAFASSTSGSTDAHRQWVPLYPGVPVAVPRIGGPSRPAAEVRAEAREFIGPRTLAQQNPPRWGVVHRDQLRADLWGPQPQPQTMQTLGDSDRRSMYVGG